VTPLASEGPHRRADGTFYNPWPDAAPHGFGDFLRWSVLERWRTPRAPDPAPGWLPRAEPRFARPRAAADAITATWVGHSTFLLQIGGLNVLTDPMWSDRASPVSFAGPRRHAAPGVALAALPPIDVVLQSHDHYDHLDDATVRAIAAAHPDAQWFVPLGVAAWLGARGVRRVRELDWWGDAAVESKGEATRQAGRVTCLPAQHFAGRGLTTRDRTLWCGWSLRCGDRAVCFAGDSGLHPEFELIARRAGPFDLALLPIGAYAPRWFMRPVHADPADAIEAYAALVRGNGGRRLVCGGMHWGTFKLTDEPLDEPPRVMRERWTAAGWPADDLWIPGCGETRAR